ncbi:unnamed protein product, partial [Allacma fusca]
IGRVGLSNFDGKQCAQMVLCFLTGLELKATHDKHAFGSQIF